jgi:hypothetical protein
MRASFRLLPIFLLGGILIVLCCTPLLATQVYAVTVAQHGFRMPTNPTPPDPNNPYGLSIGGNTGFNVLNSSGTPVAAQDYHNLGLSWARVQISWQNLFTGTTLSQVSDYHNYQWSLFDNVLQYAAQEGLLLDFPIQGAPTQFLDATCQQPTAEVTADFAQALVGHLTASQSSLPLNNLGAIEIGNEEWSFAPPHTSNCINQGATYAQVVLATAPTLQGLKSTIPQLQIGTFGFTNYDTAANTFTFWNAFYQYRDNSHQDPGKLIDYANLHFYHAGGDPNQPVNGKDPFPSIYPQIQQAGSNDKHANKPIWVTETGWAIGPYPCSLQNDVVSCRTNLVPDQATQWNDEMIMLEDGRNSPLNPSGHPLVSHVFFYTGDWNDSCIQDNNHNWVPPCTGPGKIQDGMDIMWRTPLSSGSLTTTTAYTQLEQYITNHQTWP